MPRPFLHIEKNEAWTNKHLNVTGHVERRYDVWNRWADGTRDEVPWRPGMAGLRQAIRDAEDAGTSVRAYGGRWSLSSAAYSPGFMVNTKPLAVRKIGLARSSVLSADIPRDRLVFAQCGNTIQELHDALAEKNLALKTCGASDGQTLGGAIATGTHGSGRLVGSLHDSVVGIHLLVENGKPLWIERENRPIVSEKFLSFIDTPAANLRRDEDDLFDAALVSFGSFGIVHAYLLETEPLFSFEAHARRYDFSRVKPVLGDLSLLPSLNLTGGPDPFHFEVVLDLYRLGAGKKGAYVRTMYKRPGGAPPPTPLPSGHRPGDDVLGVIGTLADVAPAAIPDLVSTLMRSSLDEYNALVGTPGYIFGPTTVRGRGLSTEMGFPIQHITRAVEVIASVAAEYPFAAVVGIRYVQASRALLAFTKYEPTCTVEIQAVYGERSRKAYQKIWKRLDEENIPFTFHWGQVLPYEPERYVQVFGERRDRWLAARRDLLSEDGRRLFGSDFVTGVGLGE